MSSTKKNSLPICFSLLLFSIVDSADLTVMKSCPGHCGGMEIPFPFGIGKGCYLEKWYEIECVKLNTSVSRNLVPVLSIFRKEIVNISLPIGYDSSLPVPYGSVRIRNRITSKGCSSGGEEEFESLLNLTGTPFYVSPSNRLVGLGCNNSASLTNVEPSVVGCKSSCGTTYPTPTTDYLASTVTLNREYFCTRTSIVGETSCNGIRCCKANMPNTIEQTVGVRIEDTDSTRKGGCKVAFLTDQADVLSNASDPQSFHANIYSTVELGWFIHTANDSFVKSLGCYGFKAYRHVNGNEQDRTNCICKYNSKLRYARCSCNDGYQGNPYLPDGCQDINECLNQDTCRGRGKCSNLPGHYECVYKEELSSRQIFFEIIFYHPLVTIGFGSIGSLIFISGMFWLYKFIRKQVRLRQKKKLLRFRGLLLQQQLNPMEGNVKTRVFSSKELVKATENFSINRILGEGGQGTVYKGMLVDGRTVAVKKSKVVEEDKLGEFINEVVILSQINHRNIVKLLGCCLETDVPVLVYEFIPNGNLFELLHDECDDNAVVATWEVRLRIAEDVAGALSYMHSSASSQIYHRHVKSTNIMLDEKCRPKVSDFGASKSVTEDHTHLTTPILGTKGYLDPEFHQSGQFTDKSDVYSFGVVLVELITGEKPISFLRSQENRSLATYFILTMKENRLSDIIDARIRDGCKVNQVTAVAKIARKCLNRKGRNRPTMREVSMQLQKIRSSPGDMEPLEYVSENEDNDGKDDRILEFNIEEEESRNYNTIYTAPASQNVVASASSSSWSDTEPLFPHQTR